MDLNFVRLIFTLKLEADSADPYALFDLKPHFMESLLQAVNCGRLQCVPCKKRDDCPYHMSFSQSLSADPAALRRYQKPSLPFVFDITLLPPVPNSGSLVELGLTIAGLAVNHPREYIAAAEGMLQSPGLRRKVRASLLKIESSGYDGTRSVIMESGGAVGTGYLQTLSLQGLQEVGILSTDAVSLTIITPMRLMTEGRPLREFSFSPFVRALFRRLSSLVYYYGGEEPELDYKWLAEQSRMVECVTANFRWVEWGSRWSGLIGEGTFAGNLSEYLPFLQAGEYLHVGKGASFGLGRFLLDKVA
ncbi:MAG TPA: CRISPR system precrRNA processing endoribonuclease RAMP protein Cas6 [Geobacteraceae bacterium]|nr:CRISPR system precrRNA processing endoribonuclease RAMP protein Cas6 [Geobacteraceae bacterium]